MKESLLQSARQSFPKRNVADNWQNANSQSGSDHFLLILDRIRIQGSSVPRPSKTSKAMYDAINEIQGGIGILCADDYKASIRVGRL